MASKRPCAPANAAWTSDGIQDLALVSTLMELLKTHKSAMAETLRGAFYDFYVEQATTRDEDGKLPTDFPRSFAVEEKSTRGTVTLKVKAVPAAGLSDETVKMLTKHKVPMTTLPRQWTMNPRRANDAKAFAAVRRLIDTYVAENPEGDIPRDFLVERPAQVTFGCEDAVLRVLRLKKPADIEAALPLLVDLSLGRTEFADDGLLPGFVATLAGLLFPARAATAGRTRATIPAKGIGAGLEKSNVVPLPAPVASRAAASRPVAARPATARRAAAK